MLLLPQLQTQTSQWRRCWCCPSDRRHLTLLWTKCLPLCKGNRIGIVTHIFTIFKKKKKKSSNTPAHTHKIIYAHWLPALLHAVFYCCAYFSVLDKKNCIMLQWLTLAAAVGWGLWHPQHSLKLLLEAVSPVQQSLQPVDELCADDVLNTQTIKETWLITM